MNFPFPKSRRLVKAAEFDRVFGRRCSQSDATLVLYGCDNELGYPRLGLVVSRKVGGAVVRTRWKRCLREAFRLAQHELPQDFDWVVLPRQGATPTTPVLQKSLVALARQIARRLSSRDSIRR